MAFGKPVSQLNLRDIQELQEEDVREGLTLEYKSENPGKEGVLKELCAFANTFGGHLILGVKEFDQERGRIAAIPGLDRIPNFEQKLRQWAVQWLYPPLTDIQVSDAIPVADPNKVCYVVHIPASLSAPHFLEKRKGCYIRIESHSMTFEPTLATLDEILRLTDRRRALIEAREGITKRAYHYCPVISQTTSTG